MCDGLIWRFVVASLIKWQESRVPAIKHYANVAAYFPNVNCTGSRATALKPLFTHRFTVAEQNKHIKTHWDQAGNERRSIHQKAVLAKRLLIAVFRAWWQRGPLSHLYSTRPAALSPAGVVVSHLSEELLQQGGGPVVVEVPVFGRVADVGRVQQQRQGFGFVNAGEGRIWTTLNADALLCSSYNWDNKQTFLE